MIYWDSCLSVGNPSHPMVGGQQNSRTYRLTSSLSWYFLWFVSYLSYGFPSNPEKWEDETVVAGACSACHSPGVHPRWNRSPVHVPTGHHNVDKPMHDRFLRSFNRKRWSKLAISGRTCVATPPLPPVLQVAGAALPCPSRAMNPAEEWLNIYMTDRQDAMAGQPQQASTWTAAQSPPAAAWTAQGLPAAGWTAQSLPAAAWASAHAWAWRHPLVSFYVQARALCTDGHCKQMRGLPTLSSPTPPCWLFCSHADVSLPRSS